jgi:hypothetical protein
VFLNTFGVPQHLKEMIIRYHLTLTKWIARNLLRRAVWLMWIRLASLRRRPQPYGQTGLFNNNNNHHHLPKTLNPKTVVMQMVVVVSPVTRPQITDTVIAGQTTTTIYITMGTSCPLQGLGGVS